MKSVKWQAAYQAAVRATNRTVHEAAAMIATQTAGDASMADDPDLVELLRRECRAKENDLIALEDELRSMRITLAGSAHRMTLHGLAASWDRAAAGERLEVRECIEALRTICDVLDAAEETAARGAAGLDEDQFYEPTLAEGYAKLKGGGDG